jgi:hypothetical protein
VRLAGAGSADEHGVALLGDEAAAGEVANEGLVDRRVLEGEVIEVLGERQPGGGDLILDRPRLLLRDLGAQEVADEALRLLLALERGRERLMRQRPSCRRASARPSCRGLAFTPSSGAPYGVVAGAVGDRRMAQAERGGSVDRRRRPGIAPPRQNVEDDIGRMNLVASVNELVVFF